jgi:hypothetical protein
VELKKQVPAKFVVALAAALKNSLAVDAPA